MENFPDDILLNIFVRLPAKQLAQMRCLSKSWNLFLSESFFIKSHLKCSIQNNHNDGVLLVFNRLFSFASKPFTPHPYRSPYLDVADFIKLPLNNPPQPQSQSNDNSRQGKVIGSVNGLVCFIYGTNHHSNSLWDEPDYIIYDGSNHGTSPVVYIWNPSLSALLTLPPYYIPSHSIQQFFRFGFDPKADDYKIVKISRRLYTSPNTVDFLDWLPVEVYSMRKGSWKFISQEIPSHVKELFDFDRLCVDGYHGHLHWLHGDYIRGYRTILAFDLGEESFREILFPDSVMGNNISTNLGVLAGKLCVISMVRPHHNKCEVWVMEEYGVAESWVKRYVFSAISGNLYPYGFTSHNEFLFLVKGRHCYRSYDALYDPVASNTKNFNFVNWDGGKVVDYVDSLVWVKPAEQREMSCCSISQFQL